MRFRASVPAGAVAALMLIAGSAACRDAATDERAGDTTVGSTATTAAPTTTAHDGTALEAVRHFAQEVVGMVDPVVGPVAAAPDDPTSATVEVRTRRENGAEDPTLPATMVEVQMVGGTWTVMAATGPQVAVDRPAPDTVLSAGVITPAGTASAYEGTVVVQVLLSTAAGTQKVAEAVTTAEGTEHAPWSARVVTGGDVSGAGYVLASTTAGTDRGAPAFALVPVMFGASPGGAAVLPDDPRAYAQAALEAWLAGDAATLGELAAPEVVQALFAHAPAHETSSSPRCEGAAGSTACTWTASREEIVLRVDNAAAAARQRHAVFEARFEAR